MNEPQPAAAIFPLVYEELKRLAAARLDEERADHTLQPTALVHEAWLRFEKEKGQRFLDRGHFLQAAASSMRRILIDHARRKKAEKRGGGLRPETLDGAASSERPDEVLAVDEALARLAEVDPRKARMVELRFFGGLELEELAGVLEVSTRTLKRDWAFARAWLYREVTRGDADR